MKVVDHQPKNCVVPRTPQEPSQERRPAPSDAFEVSTRGARAPRSVSRSATGLRAPSASKGWLGKAAGVLTVALAASSRSLAQAALMPTGVPCYPWGTRDVQNVTYGFLSCAQTWDANGVDFGPINDPVALSLAQKLRTCADQSNATITRGSRVTPIFLGVQPAPKKGDPGYEDYAQGVPAIVYHSEDASGTVLDCFAPQLHNAYGL